MTQTPTPMIPAAESNVTVPILTTVPTPALSKAARVTTQVAEERATVDARSTARALGTQFAYTPIPVPTSKPMPTPQTGISGCAGGISQFIPSGCWAGPGNGDFVFVTTGVFSRSETQGVIQVLTTTLDQRTFGPQQTYPIPEQISPVYPAQVTWPYMTLIAPVDNAPTHMFVFNLHTRTWEPPDSCPIYPIALHQTTLQGVRPRYDARQIQQGTAPGAFGWLTWRGETTDTALAQSLTGLGDSQSSINPNNTADHILASGKWVGGRAVVAGGAPVAAALDALRTTNYRVVVPIWDQTTGTGNTLRYHIASFAWVSLDDVANANQLTIRYWGQATCPPNP